MNVKIKLAFLLVMTVCLTIGYFFTAKSCAESIYWYRIEISYGNVMYGYFGTSNIAESDIIKVMTGQEPLLLSDLVYIDQNMQVKSWADYISWQQPRIYINPKNIVTIMPLRGDPRNE